MINLIAEKYQSWQLHISINNFSVALNIDRLKINKLIRLSSNQTITIKQKCKNQTISTLGG